MTIDIDLAATMRAIAEESKDTEKVLKAIHKAALKGKSALRIEISEEDYSYFYYKEHPYLNVKYSTTPLIERLLTLGFKFRNSERNYGGTWFPKYRYYTIVYW